MKHPKNKYERRLISVKKKRQKERSKKQIAIPEAETEHELERYKDWHKSESD